MMGCFIKVLAALLFLLVGTAVSVRAQTPPNPVAVPQESKPNETALQSRADGALRNRIDVAHNAATHAVNRFMDGGSRGEIMLNTYLYSAGLTVDDLNKASFVNGDTGDNQRLAFLGLRGLAQLIYDVSDAALLAAANRHKINWYRDAVAAALTEAALLRPKSRARLLMAAAAKCQMASDADTLVWLAGREGKWAPDFAKAILSEQKERLSPPIIAVFERFITNSAEDDWRKEFPRKSTAQWDAKARRYLPAKSDRPATIALGKRFFCLSESKTHFTDVETGKLVPWSQVLLHILTVRAIEKRDMENEEIVLRFALEGYPHLVRWQGNDDPNEMGGLYALLTDNNARYLQKRFVGRRVWAYPVIHFSLVTDDPLIGASISPQVGQSTRVMGIYRLKGFTLLENGETSDPIDAPTHLFRAYDPLFILLKTERQDLNQPIVAGGYGLNYVVFNNSPAAKAHVLGSYEKCADTWDFYRLFSPISLKSASRKWARVYRMAIRESRLHKGMTPDMVAWVMGWPPDFGTLDQFRHRSHWVYTAFHGDFSVDFKKGKVVSWLDNSTVLP